MTNGEEKDLKVGSVTVILQQALHSRDKKQIGKILTYTDNALIRVSEWSVGSTDLVFPVFI